LSLIHGHEKKAETKNTFEELGPLSRWYDKDMKHPAARTPDMTYFLQQHKL